MGKGKLAKFAEMAENPLVVEPRYNPEAETADFALQGNWKRDFFHNDNPIVLELGCGRGEYTVGLAELYPDKNFIGVDIKGSRMWTGATDALHRNMKNVAFLRTNIEFIWQFFGKDEVSEIWLTFSDPQMKKATKRLSSTYFLKRYRRFMVDGGLIHLKTDSNFLFTYTEEMLKANGIVPEVSTRNLTSPIPGHILGDTQSPTSQGGENLESSTPEGGNSTNSNHTVTPPWEVGDSVSPSMCPGMGEVLIQTYYESMWRARGIAIKYLRFRLPQSGELVEPKVEIELDEYRSYSREKRSGLETHK